MKAAVAVAFALVAAACTDTPVAGPESEAPGVAEPQLSCHDFATATRAAIVDRFGAANVVEETLSAEGEDYQATVAFPGDPARRLEIVWRDAAQTSPYSVMVTSETSIWTGPSGLLMHATLEDVEAANGRPFTLSGFGWDYGGVVLDWEGGAFDGGACRVMAYFDPTKVADAVQGDRPFRSDLPAMRAAAPRVRQFGLMFE